ncbi:aldo/keto reductase [Silvibacterium acidisoli]|uniref:aldo/keto reductase n=1 Tax=Acidobacteriaceae bacterium ZG23-2 TaxID=2883246 RepID=UPI00406CCFD6
MDRRDFLKTATIAAGAAATGPWSVPALRAEEATPESNGMIYRTLGNTGVRVSALGLGGYHIGRSQISEDDSIKLMRAAIDRGINFLDNCWDYNDGVSEVRMGKALRGGYRDRAFLMTKIDGRTKEAATQQIDESLKRLQVDRVDLMQLHEVIRLEDPDRAFAEGGAIEALQEAKQSGKIRFIGFTGHKDPYVHLRMLETAKRNGFHFDTVQMPVNVMDAHFRSFTHDVLPVLHREGIAPLGMKAFGDHFILDSNTVKPIECLHYCLNLPVAVQITGIDSMQILDQAFEATRTFKPMTEQQVASLLERTRAAAQVGKFELYKTTNHFDGTAHNPQLLG